MFTWFYDFSIRLSHPFLFFKHQQTQQIILYINKLLTKQSKKLRQLTHALAHTWWSSNIDTQKNLIVDEISVKIFTQHGYLWQFLCMSHKKRRVNDSLQKLWLTYYGVIQSLNRHVSSWNALSDEMKCVSCHLFKGYCFILSWVWS